MHARKPDFDLREMQTWFYRVISHAEGVAAGEALLPGERVVTEEIKPSSRLGAAERMSIYHQAYYLRLLKVFETEYPALRHALGEDLFKEMSGLYLQHWPPQSYTLQALSARFADFIISSVPEEDAHAMWPRFIADLARLERSFQEVYHCEEPLVARTVASGETPWTLAAGLCCLMQDFPLREYLLAARKKSPIDIPAPTATALVLLRRNYRVHILVISDLDEARALNQFLEQGQNNNTCLPPEEYHESWRAKGWLL